MKSEHYKRVEQFMELAGQRCPDEPTEPTEEERLLRARLMLEEVLETIWDGLGVSVQTGHNDTVGSADGLLFEIVKPFNLVETIDGCLDTKVVTTGTLVACGVPDEELQHLVDENNLAKFGPGGYRDVGGKWIKPEGHKPPDIQGELDRQKVQREVNKEYFENLQRQYDEKQRIREGQPEIVVGYNFKDQVAVLREERKDVLIDAMVQANQASVFSNGVFPEGGIRPKLTDTQKEQLKKQIVDYYKGTQSGSKVEIDPAPIPVTKEVLDDLYDALDAAGNAVDFAPFEDPIKKAIHHINRLSQNRWKHVEVVTGPGYEVGVAYDQNGKLVLKIKKPEADVWPEADGVGDPGPNNSLVVREGCMSYVVLGSSDL